jgi:hypothetical protein
MAGASSRDQPCASKSLCRSSCDRSSSRVTDISFFPPLSSPRHVTSTNSYSDDYEITFPGQKARDDAISLEIHLWTTRSKNFTLARPGSEQRTRDTKI